MNKNVIIFIGMIAGAVCGFAIAILVYPPRPANEFERGAMFTCDFHKLNGHYPSVLVRERAEKYPELIADSFDLETESGRINAGLDTASLRLAKEEIKRWKRQVTDNFYREHNIDSTEFRMYVVTCKDKDGKLLVIWGVPDLIPEKPEIDTQFIEVSSAIIEL